ncbi:MAG: hypothetical protein IJT39_06955 [Bacteroidales bacterium]|nr:hypothetical protein [Bacteroidales bacterium]
MKKGVKITLISVGSLLGLILIVVGVALWLVFTPSRLTSIVNNLSNKYIDCESHFESVDLTLFSTYPDVGLEIHDVALVNPMEGAPSDTLLQVGRLVVGLDLKALLNGGNIIVKQLQLNDMKANLYVASDGKSNFDIFPKSEDTTSSTFKLPDSIRLHSIAINNLSATWTDRKNGMEALADDLDLTVEGDLTNGDLQADLMLACQQLDMHNGSGEKSMQVNVNGLTLNLDAKGDNISMDKQLSLDKMQAAVKLSCREMGYRGGNNEKQMVFNVNDFDLRLDANGNQHTLAGQLATTLPQALVRMAGKEYCNANTAKHGDLVALNVPFSVNLDKQQIQLDTAALTLDGTYRLNLNGAVNLPSEQQPLHTDVAFSTNRWNVVPLLALLPAEFTSWKKGMDLGAAVQLNGTCRGEVSDSVMPNVDATLRLINGHWADARKLPGAVRNIAGTVRAQMKPTHNKKNPFVVNAQVQQLQAQWQHTDVAVDASATDVLGRMPFQAHLKANTTADDAALFLPDTLPLTFAGTAHLEAYANATLSQVRQQDWQRMQAQLQLQLADLDVRYDSIHATTPSISLNARLVDGGTAPAVAFNLATALMDGHYGAVGGNVNRLSVRGQANYDSSKENLFDMLKPAVRIDLHEATVYTPSIQQVMRVNDMKMNYADGRCDTVDISLVCGLSDYHLTGHIDGVEDYLVRKQMLRGRLDFHSTYTDVDQLMTMFSGLGTDKDTLEAQKLEAPATANPFIVPKNVDIAFNTHIDNCLAFGNKLSHVGGGLTVNDGVVVLDQMGFVCKAARMQLTGVYKTPRFNHLFVGLDFHLLDIQIDELIDMIPTIDTLVPMLKSFKGNADFHLAAETYLFADYKPKYSTMLGAAAISGKDLVVLDNETFDKISSLLMFKKKTENKIDSLDVEMTVFRNELEVFPFLLSMDKYQVCVAGRHTLDNNCNYHLELLKCPLPVRLAVDVKGDLKKPKISLGKVRYAELFKPEKQNKVQERTMEIKRQVRQALERNVR